MSNETPDQTETDETYEEDFRYALDLAKTALEAASLTNPDPEKLVKLISAQELCDDVVLDREAVRAAAKQALTDAAAAAGPLSRDEIVREAERRIRGGSDFAADTRQQLVEMAEWALSAAASGTVRPDTIAGLLMLRREQLARQLGAKRREQVRTSADAALSVDPRRTVTDVEQDVLAAAADDLENPDVAIPEMHGHRTLAARWLRRYAEERRR